MKKVLCCLMAVMISVSVVGCSNEATNSEQTPKEVAESFFKEFYTYEYSGDQSALQSSETILNQVKPLLATDSRINTETIAALVVKPAVHSKVSVNLASVVLSNEADVEVAGKSLKTYTATIEVKITHAETNDSKVVTQSIGICFIQENDSWKIEGLDYMADDYLFTF